MISPRKKDIYLNLLGLLNKVNFYWQRAIFVPLRYRKRVLDLHLGSGHHYLENFLNIELNPLLKKEIWLDVRNGLPFQDNSVNSIYSHQFVEHFYFEELNFVFKECHRVLKAGCGMRLGVPNLVTAIKGYAKNDLSWVSDFPKHFESLGGKFYSFIFCNGEHKICFDFGLLEEILSRAGFREISSLKAGESQIYTKMPFSEYAQYNEYLYVECFKK